jgi:hypothetical protein
MQLLFTICISWLVALTLVAAKATDLDAMPYCAANAWLCDSMNGAFCIDRGKGQWCCDDGSGESFSDAFPRRNGPFGWKFS